MRILKLSLIRFGIGLILWSLFLFIVYAFVNMDKFVLTWLTVSKVLIAGTLCSLIYVIIALIMDFVGGYFKLFENKDK